MEGFGGILLKEVVNIDFIVEVIEGVTQKNNLSQNLSTYHESGTPFKTGGENPKTPLFIFSSTFINSFLLIFFIITNRYERCF